MKPEKAAGSMIKGFFGHFKTVAKHRRLVRRNCFKCGIPLQGLKHDLSKYSPTEFIAGCRYFTGTHSPNEGERLEKGYSAAWLHHKGRNKHHFEYWNDVDLETKKYVPVKMPYRYLAEMLCDRVAASRVYKGKDYTNSSALEYFMHGHGREQMHPETAKELEKLLTMIKDEGEDAAFAYVKKKLKSGDVDY